MTINLTLVVQIFHFIIAYFIISRLLLKPAIAIITCDENVEKDLLNLIKKRQMEVSDKEFVKNSLWQDSLVMFEKEKPIIKDHLQSFALITPKPISIDKSEILNLRNEVSKIIINRVKNV